MRIWMFRNAAIVILAAWPVVALATPSYTAVILGPADSYAYAAANGVQAGYVYGSGPTVWYGSGASATLLPFKGFSFAGINATNGTSFGGGGAIGIASFHALLWPNVSSSPIDLTPTGDDYATVYTMAGDSQGGIVSKGYYDLVPHAALWQGTAASFQDLNPSGFDSSQILAMTTTQQVGQATFNVDEGPPNPPQPITHAILWNDSARDYSDLNPSWATDSRANAIFGIFQGGAADGHATIWNGTAASATDINPDGMRSSTITSMAGEYQAGYADTGSTDIAGIWEGSSDSFINLQQYLPSAFVASAAYGVDDQGDVVGSAHIFANNHDYAVLWMAPEPTSIAIFAAPILMVLFGRRHSVLRG